MRTSRRDASTCAIRFAEEGANVAINYRSGSEQAEVTKCAALKANPGGKHMTVQADAEPWLVRARSAEMLRNHFGVEHTTLQVEREGDEHRLLQIRQQLRGRDA